MMPSRHEFIAGTISLSFVDTLGGRGAAEVERLADPEDLAGWLVAAGLVGHPAPSAGDADVEAARALREAIHRCGAAQIEKVAMAPADVAVINGWAVRPPLRPQLTLDGGISPAAASIEAALSSIAADAIATLARPMAERLRRCPECRMVFLDNSRAGGRRWCSSTSGCGNRAKVRNHRARRAGTVG